MATAQTTSRNCVMKRSIKIAALVGVVVLFVLWWGAVAFMVVDYLVNEVWWTVVNSGPMNGG